MPFANLKPDKQAKYMQLLHTEALKKAKAQNPPLFDPQGRILIEVQKLTRKQLVEAGLSKKDIKEVAGQKTVVSVDVSADEDLAEQFYERVENALERALSEPELLKKLKKEDKKPPRTTAEVIEALKELPKGSVISLQQEYNYHLRLASRVYQQSAPALIGKEKELASALDKALLKTNELIMRHYALAIAQSYSGNSIDLAKLNKELDKARKTIANSAHRILRDEIRQHTGVLLDKDSLLKAEVDAEVLKEQAIIDQSYKNKIAKGIAAIVPERIAPEVKPDRDKIRSKLLTKLAEDTVASEDNLLHLDARLGTAVWIEGSKVTAHDRHIKEDDDELATRQIIRHQFKEGTVTAYPSSRVQIRVPSLDAKSKTASEEEQIKDVQNKISHITDKYFAKAPQPPFFVYNLYTSINHTLDDLFKDNLQTQGVKQILKGAHLYNAIALKEGKPLCLVQNIPINGFGSDLGPSRSKRVNEATLMSEIALMYSLLGKDDPRVVRIQENYAKFLNDPILNKGYFSGCEHGKAALKIIQEEIKNPWKDIAPSQAKDQILDNAKAYLKYIVANDLHYKSEYSKLTQTLSVFIEEYSIGGCKSANERAQAINGRVLMLDALLITDPNAPLPDERHKLMEALTKPHDPAGLKAALDGAYNALGLQSAAALISFMDQGAAAKGLARNPHLQGFNGNYFEESSLSNLSQNKAGAMQAHKGLTSKMLAACDDSRSEKLPLPQGVMLGVENDLEEQIGDYSTFGKAKDADEVGQEFVNARLKSAEARAHLYEGIDDYSKRHYALIVKYCDKFKLPIPEESSDFFRKQFIELCARKQFEDFSGDKAKRKLKPESATKSLEELFGEQGAALYKLALSEERHTKEYMNAVFQESTTHSAGNKWKTRPVIIVAGPSACGKSTAANAAIEQANTALPTDPDNSDGNDIVAADGGVAREVSQMRKLVIQLATEHGFSGVSDLHSKSNVLGDVKDCILEAAYATDSLGVVIPETFAKGKTSAKMFERIDKLKDSTPMWIRVTGENASIFSTLMDKITTTFREAVSYMGSRRAFKTSGFKDELDEDARPETSYDLNISKDSIPESKAYGGFFSFAAGWWGSYKAEKNFKNHYPNGITYTLVNDLILLKPNELHGPKDKQWTQGKQDSEGVIMVSKTTYNAWLKDPSNTTLEKYAKDNRKALIYTEGQFALVGAMKAVEAEYNKAPAGSPLKVFLKDINDNLSDLKKLDSTEKIEELFIALETFTSKHKSTSALAKLTEGLDKRYHELKLVEYLKESKNLSEEDKLLKTKWEEIHTEQSAVIDKQILARKPIEAIQEALISLKKIPTQSTMDGPLVKKEDAASVKEVLKDLTQECTRNLELLHQQKEELVALMNDLNEDFSPSKLRGTLIRTEVGNHCMEIDKQLKEIQRIEKEILLPMQKILAPDGEGLNKRIDTASQTDEPRHRVVAHFTITTQDKKLTDIGSVVKVKDYDEDLDEHGHGVSGTINAAVHDSIPALENGNYREHSIKITGDGKPLGVVTEIHHPRGLASDKSAEPSVTYTNTENKAQTTEEKILAAFATATLILGNLKNKPDKNHKITLNGNDKESVEFLFTALMVLGDKSSMKFNADAIRVRALVFAPEKELGRISRYSDDSCYNKHFKQHSDITKQVVENFNTLLKSKSTLAEEQQTATTTLTHTTHKYKAQIGQLKEEVEVATQRLEAR